MLAAKPECISLTLAGGRSGLSGRNDILPEAEESPGVCRGFQFLPGHLEENASQKRRAPVFLGRGSLWLHKRPDPPCWRATGRGLATTDAGRPVMA
jgi:hypothetical protein